jgi:hypothetical protein
MFEIKLLKRDKTGKPIPGQYMEFATEDAGALAVWFARNAPTKKRKRKKNNKKAEE